MSILKSKNQVLLFAILVASVLSASCSGSGDKASKSEHGAQEPAVSSHEEHDDQTTVVELTPEVAARAGIRTEPVEERILEGKIETTGRVDFDETRLAHVSPRIPGRVHQTHALLGQEVQAGETLAEIDSIELGKAKAEYLQAKAKEELAQKSFERARELFADRISSEQEVLVAEAGFREATAALHTAEETLHLYGLSQDQVDSLHYDDRKASIFPLRAPFGGTIVEKHATLGELVTPERNLFTLADLSRVWIWIDVYERDLRRVHLDDGVRAHADAYPGEVFEGVVSYLSSQVDVDTRTLRARLTVANPRRKLRPGMFMRVELFEPHEAEGRQASSKSRVVPASAVQRDGEQLITFVPTGAFAFERREVRVGRSAGGFVEILDGLEAGEQVVVEGAFLLKSEISKKTMGGGHTP